MQAADLSSTYYELFRLPVSYSVDTEVLAQRYRELQRAVHPDKFASAQDAERRLSVQLASRINEGFRVLKDPLSRARYLLELRGVEINDQDTALDGAFLMDQMELRERMDEAKDAADPLHQLQQLGQDIAAREQALIAELTAQFQADDEAALLRARDTMRKLQFFRRLEQEVTNLEDEWATS
jgi:molecular chaperone HscB